MCRNWWAQLREWHRISEREMTKRSNPRNRRIQNAPSKTSEAGPRIERLKYEPAHKVGRRWWGWGDAGDVLVHVIEPLPRLIGRQEPGHVHDLASSPEVERGHAPHCPPLHAVCRNEEGLLRFRLCGFSSIRHRGGACERSPQQSRDIHRHWKWAGQSEMIR